MRILASLVAIVGFSIPTVSEVVREGQETPAQEKKGVGGKKVDTACNKSDVSGLVLEVCVSEMNIAGAPIACTVKVENTTKDTITYLHTAALREVVLEIKDLKGIVVPHTRYGKLIFEGEDGRFIQRKLGPGKSITLTYDLARCFDLSLVGDYSLSAVSRRTMVKDMKISVDSVKFSVKDN